MRKLSRNQIGFESYSIYYILPYNREDESDEEIINKTAEFLSKNRSFNTNMMVNNTKIDKNWITISLRYEGHSDYYDYDLEFEVVNYEDNRLMLLGYILQDVHEIFEEIIVDKILPKFSEMLGLKNFYG